MLDGNIAYRILDATGSVTMKDMHGRFIGKIVGTGAVLICTHDVIYGYEGNVEMFFADRDGNEID